MSAPFTASFQAAYDGALAAAERLLHNAGDPGAAQRLAAARALPENAHPVVAVVGEAKRGKSSLVNMLLQQADLSPVGVTETTAAPLAFRYGDPPTARVHLSAEQEVFPVPVADLAEWVTVAGAEAGRRPPTRLVEVEVPVPSLRSFTLVDTPGLGGLTSGVGQLTLQSLETATVLVFVGEVHSELTSVELEFLRVAAERIDTVLIALTSAGDLGREDLDLVIEADRERLRETIPRLADVPIFPVDYATAERALREPDAAGKDARWERSGFAALQRALTETTTRRGWSLLYQSTLRFADSLLREADSQLAKRAAALDDPQQVQALQNERDRLADQRRTLARKARGELNVEVNNARLDIGQQVARELRKVEEDYRSAITERRIDLRQLPEQVAADLERVSVEVSAHLARFAQRFSSDRLAEVFTTDELEQITAQLGQRILLLDGSTRLLPTANRDLALTVATSVGPGFMAGGATYGGLTATLGAASGGTLLIPIVAVGAGTAAAGALLKLRAASQKRSEALGWLQRTMPDVRQELTSSANTRINEAQSAIALALEDVLDERIAQLSAQIAQIDHDRKDLAARPAALKSQRASITTSLETLSALGARLRESAPRSRDAAPREG